MWQFLAASLIFFENIYSQFSPDQALQWHSPVTPEKYSFQPSQSSHDEKVTLLLSDSAVLSTSKLYHRYQIFAIDRLVDHSDPSLMGFNLQQQIARFGKDKLARHENFISLPSFYYEYRFHHQVTFDQCQTLCLFQKANMITSILHIFELRKLVPRAQEFMWAHINQTFSDDKKYEVKFDSTEILPMNRFNNSTTQLYHYHEGHYQELPFAGLHGRVKYYTYERQSYYSRQPHQLLARVNVSNDWQVLIPQWSGTQPSQFAMGLCTCVRDISNNIRNAQRAAELAEEARFRTIRSPQQLEVQRVRQVSPSPDLSNVESILKNQQYYVPQQRAFMTQNDLYDLRLEAGSSPGGLSYDGNTTRHRRALPMAASLGLGVISKMVQFSLPYMLKDGKAFMKALKRETGGLLLRAPQSDHTNMTFQEYISQRFSPSPANFTVESDRLVIGMQDRHSVLGSLADPNIEQAQQLGRVSRQLQYIEQNVLPWLPHALLHQIIRDLPYPLRPGSDILFQTKSSGTFSVIRYFLELHRHDLSYTEIHTFALPFKQVERRFYAFSIPNTTTLDITNDKQESLQDKECINTVLTSAPANLAQVCPQTEYNPQIYRHIFTLETGIILIFPGPSLVALQCYKYPAMQISLPEQFNVLYLSNTCSASIIYQKVSFMRKGSSLEYDPTPYQILLSLTVPELASNHEKLYFWMIGLSSCISVLMVVVLFIYFSMSFVKLKYKPKISVNEDGFIDVSVQNVERKGSSSMDLPHIESESQDTCHTTNQGLNTPVTYKPSQETLQISAEALSTPIRAHANPFVKKAKPVTH